MDIALVGASQEENLSLRYLAPPLRAAGHTVRILEFDDPGDLPGLVRRLVAAPTELVGMSVAFQHRLSEFHGLAAALRAAGVTAPIVWGGHIPTARPGHILERYPEVDLIVRHDGEETLAELVTALAAAPPLAPPDRPDAPRGLPAPLCERLKDVAGLAFRLPDGRPAATPPRPAVADLDALLPPARDGQPASHAGLAVVPILGSRGCWQHCTYCSIHTYHRGRGGPRVRLRAPEAIAAEIAELYQRRQARVFCFHDENFFLPRPSRTLRRLAALRAALDSRGVGKIGLVAKCRPDELDADVLAAARDLGLVRAYVGIENGSQAGLAHLGRDTDVATCRRALQLLRAADLFACFNVLLFEPDSTLADVAENLTFLEDFCDFPWNFCRTEVYPGSLLEARLQATGRLHGGLEGLNYVIADPRVELLFRITAVAFGGRNFGSQSTANGTSGVGYLAALVERFHPGRAARAWKREASALTKQVGRDTLAHLRRAFDFVSAAPPTPSAVERFTLGLARDIARSDAAVWPALQRLRLAIERHGQQRAVDVYRPPVTRRVVARAAALVAAAGLAAQACSGDPEAVDPAPPDIRADADIPWVDPPPPDVSGDSLDVRPDIPWVDPLPPDMVDAGLRDTPPDIPWVDPPPPDMAGGDTRDAPPDIPWVDPPPPDMVSGDSLDVRPDIPWVDPPPPDMVGGDTAEPTPDIPWVDPLPPDMFGGDGAAAGVPAGLPAQGPRVVSGMPLDRAFRVALDVLRETPECVELRVRTPAAAPYQLHFEAWGGTLQVAGERAAFRPDGSGPPLVVVVARGPGARLDVARYIPRGR